MAGKLERDTARAIDERIMRKMAKSNPYEYPHTLTSEQFAIISVALDAARERESAYVAKHADSPDDHLCALDELRKLWAFAGPIVLNARGTK